MQELEYYEKYFDILILYDGDFIIPTYLIELISTGQIKNNFYKLLNQQSQEIIQDTFGATDHINDN